MNGDELSEWCEQRDPDPFGVGWDDPNSPGQHLAFHHVCRVLGCVLRNADWSPVRAVDALRRWLTARRDR